MFITQIHEECLSKLILSPKSKCTYYTRRLILEYKFNMIDCLLIIDVFDE